MHLQSAAFQPELAGKLRFRKPFHEQGVNLSVRLFGADDRAERTFLAAMEPAQMSPVGRFRRSAGQTMAPAFVGGSRAMRMIHAECPQAGQVSW